MFRNTTTVQDGHSGNEESVYKALWAKGSEVLAEYREVTIGYRAIARKTQF